MQRTKWTSTVALAFAIGVGVAGLGSIATTALAADPEFTIVIKDHVFTPSEVRVPAGKKVKLIVDNQDASAEEFESKELKREKVIPPRSKGTVMIGPLKPGRYSFVGEFHEKTAHGAVIAE